MKLRFLCLAALLFGVCAQAQETQPDRIRALGTFDQIAEQCARGGSDAEVDAFRLKLWHAYLLAQGAADTSAQDIRVAIAGLRAQIIDDVSNELRRQYKNARAAIPDVRSLSAQAQNEFYDLCEAPRIRGIPGRG